MNLCQLTTEMSWNKWEKEISSRKDRKERIEKGKWFSHKAHKGHIEKGKQFFHNDRRNQRL